MRSPFRSAAWLALFGALLSGCPQSKAPSQGPVATPSPQASASLPPPSAGPQPRGQQPRLEQVAVPGGTFVMGSEGAQAGGQDSERPRATRQVMPFSIDVYEVTNEAYALFLASPDSREHVFCHAEEPANKDHTPAGPTPSERTWGAVIDPFGAPGRAKHPVVGVDWFDAYAFAAWLGRRLPSEDEWERAARGTDGRTYPWGEAPIREGVIVRATTYDAVRRTMTTEVGGRPDGRATCGALDMAGNVWEWTASPFLAYSGAPEGSEDRPELRVLRGGGWNSSAPFLLRAAMRHARPPTYRSAALGFRTARSGGDRPSGESK